MLATLLTFSTGINVNAAETKGSKANGITQLTRDLSSISMSDVNVYFEQRIDELNSEKSTATTVDELKNINNEIQRITQLQVTFH